jgi:hypothetical protein
VLVWEVAESGVAMAMLEEKVGVGRMEVAKSDDAIWIFIVGLGWIILLIVCMNNELKIERIMIYDSL